MSDFEIRPANGHVYNNGMPRKSKHGHCRVGHSTPAYRKWRAMIDRCNPNSKNKKHLENYVSRGIAVCARWLDFQSFLEDMGQPAEGMEIERKDNDVGYEPGNCKWATRVENQSNRRVSINVEYQGRTQSLKAWSKELNLHYVTLIYRIKHGWSAEKAFSTLGRAA